jgi:hypothetical protein
VKLKIRPGDLILIAPTTLVGGGEYNSADSGSSNSPDWESEGESGIVISTIPRLSPGDTRSAIVTCVFPRGIGWVYNDEVEEITSAGDDAHDR